MPDKTEPVLRSGERLAVKNKNGTLAIKAEDESTRAFDWQNVIPGTSFFGKDDLSPHRMTVWLIPARERRDGAFGMYGCQRVVGEADYTLNYEEAQLNFRDLDDFNSWRSWPTHGPLFLDYVYRNDGLLVGYAVGSDSGASPKLDVNLYRVCIGGRPPSHLPGAQDSNISITRPAQAPAGVARYTCAAANFPLHEAYETANQQYEFNSWAVRRIQAFDASPSIATPKASTRRR